MPSLGKHCSAVRALVGGSCKNLAIVKQPNCWKRQWDWNWPISCPVIPVQFELWHWASWLDILAFFICSVMSVKSVLIHDISGDSLARRSLILSSWTYNSSWRASIVFSILLILSEKLWTFDWMCFSLALPDFCPFLPVLSFASNLSTFHQLAKAANSCPVHWIHSWSLSGTCGCCLPVRW